MKNLDISKLNEIFNERLFNCLHIEQVLIIT